MRCRLRRDGPIAPSKPPKPWRAERSRKGRSHLLFAVEHADRMRTVTRVYAPMAEFLRQCPESVPAL
jgi:hypothetical protein